MSWNGEATNNNRYTPTKLPTIVINAYPCSWWEISNKGRMHKI